MPLRHPQNGQEWIIATSSFPFQSISLPDAPQTGALYAQSRLVLFMLKEEWASYAPRSNWRYYHILAVWKVLKIGL